MISYMILHYNRPYLLEPNIKLIRKFIPNAQIIIADDGSDADVIKKISTFDIDDLYVQKMNKNTWTEGTCSTTIKKARKLCKHDFILFSEDDFFYCNQPLSIPYDVESGCIAPKVYFKDNCTNIIEEAVSLLTVNDSVKNVQFAKDSIRVPISTSVQSNNYKWFFVDHKQKPVCYYCNWPSMLRKSEYFSVPIESGYAIWKFEGILSKAMRNKFGSGDWAVVPDRRFYAHVGMAFSKRLNDFVYSKKRSKYGRKIQEQMFKKIVEKNVEGFGSFLMKSYMNNRFVINFDEMINLGLNESFILAFERLSKYV